MAALAGFVLHAARALPAWRKWRAPRIRAAQLTDRERVQAFVRGLSPRSRYLRFFRPLPELPSDMLERLLHADAARERVLLAVVREARATRVVGLAQYAQEDDGGCEFALAVADDWQGRGLGARLLRTLIDAAEAAGIAQIRGEVLRENRAMLRLARTLGFSVAHSPIDASALRIVRPLSRATPRAAAQPAGCLPRPA
ncbi:MAG: GNAT family N-acetyltransferase [Burkholderiales bacterium]|nr:GNAT family N-acetyltransferase [Burkholderiales bacterium]